jgi:hypothetical protein
MRAIEIVEAGIPQEALGDDDLHRPEQGGGQDEALGCSEPHLGDTTGHERLPDDEQADGADMSRSDPLAQSGGSEIGPRPSSCG